MDTSSSWLLFAAVFGMGIGITLAIDKLMKSLASDSSKVQALLAEIRDKLGK